MRIENLAGQAIVDNNRRGDCVGNGCQQNSGGNGANCPKMTGRRPHPTAHQHRAGIEREPKNYCKDVVPADRL